jgi:hypothetical protein
MSGRSFVYVSLHRALKVTTQYQQLDTQPIILGSLKVCHLLGGGVGISACPSAVSLVNPSGEWLSGLGHRSASTCCHSTDSVAEELPFHSS